MKLKTKINLTFDARISRWSNDSQKIAIGGTSGGIVLYSRDLVTLDVIQEYVEGIRSLAWSPDDDSLAFAQTMNADRTDGFDTQQRIRIWNIEQNKSEQILFSEENTSASVLAWNHEKLLLAAALISGEIHIWSTLNWNKITQLTETAESLRTLFWLNSEFLGGFDHASRFYIWNINTGELYYHTDLSIPGMMLHVDAAPKSNFMLYISLRGVLRIWDLTNHIHLEELDQAEQEFRLAYWMDGDRFVVGLMDDSNVIVWDRRDNTQYDAPTSSYSVIAVCPTSPIVALLEENGGIKIWDVLNHTTQQLVETSKVKSLDWSPDGSRLLAKTKDRKLWLWDTQGSAKLIASPDEKRNLGGLQSMSLHPSKNLLLQGFEAGRYGILNLSTNKHQSLSTGHRESLHESKWSPDGSRYVLTGWNGSIYIFDSKHRLLGHSKLDDLLKNVTWKSDNSAIAGFVANLAVVLDLDGKVIHKYEASHFSVWNNDLTKFVSIKAGSSLRVTTMDGSVTSQQLPSTVMGISIISWHNNGQFICMGTHTGSIVVWDIKSQKVILQASHHASRIEKIAWHPILYLVASGGADNKLMIWDIDTKRPTNEFFHTSTITGLDWGQDGNKLIAASIDGFISIWINE